MAEATKIPWEQFRWCAVFHDQDHHPYIHMVCYSADGRSGFFTRKGIAQIKPDLAKRIFHQEFHELYEQQTQRWDELTQEVGAVVTELVQQMREGALDNSRIEQLMEHLARKSKNLPGKKQHGYLKVSLKSVVDETMEEPAGGERVAWTYELRYELREEVLRAYKEDLPLRLPLSRQKEFEWIRNIVIEEVLRLGYAPTVSDLTASEEAPFERDIPEAGGEALKEPELLVDTEYIGPEGTRNHRGRPDNPHTRYQLARIILADPATEPEQFRTALEWLTEAAEAGQVHAQYEPGKIYRDGRSVEKDALLVAAWLTRAAEQDSGVAAYALGVLLLTGGEGLVKNVSATVSWLRRSAEGGNQYARYRLGRSLLQGEGAPREIEEAVRWLTVFAERGNQYVQYALGKLYLIGKEVPWDPKAAARWFTLSAAQGNEYAQYTSAYMDKGPSILSYATRLLHHPSGIFQERAPRGPVRTVTFTDRKLRQRIREKKMAMGRKPDDHEDAEISMR